MTDRELMQQARGEQQCAHGIDQKECGWCARQEQEPVVWMYQDKSTHEVRFQKHMRGFVDHGATYETPLYTAPPQRTWVGLTDEDLSVCDEDGLTLARYWEAKLKEKNA